MQDKSRLKITQFGNPILRQKARELSQSEITSNQTWQLISRMRQLLLEKDLGVGLAAQQVGEPIALALIEVHKTALRLTAEELSLVIMNPKILKFFGRKSQLWEGCISSGAGSSGLFAKVPRYKKIEVEYYDENGLKHTSIFEELAAHVIQHEVDHMNGVLFVDKVKDSSTFMTYSEYKKMRKNT